MKEKIIRLPVIYDAGGDISKKWFIEFYVRNPRTGRMERQRMSKGINKHHTLKQRQAAAEEMRQHWTDKLKAGWSPFTDELTIYDDNLQYQTFIKNYHTTKAQNGTFKYYASKYIDSIRSEIEDTTVSTYRSKMRLFDAWLQNKQLADADISAITQPVMVEFMVFIIEKLKRSKVTVDNYRILLTAVFDFVRKDKKRKLYPNPCFDLPGTKRINDSAAEPILDDDIPVFKNAIEKNDPQLWLAISFEYYCFMRPRKEIRFLRISDINWGLAQIKVRYENSKTKERFVNIPRPLMTMLRQEYQLHTYPRNYYIFGHGGQPGPTHLSINNLSNRFADIRNNLQMPVMYKMYSWKHTGIIHARRAGVPDPQIQHQSGHTSIVTTERYMRKMVAPSSPELVENGPVL